MSASAWMKTRSPDSMASQFGAHAWFRKRALLPPRLPSITRPSETPNTNVWPTSARWRGGPPPAGQLTRVFDKPLAGGDGLQREEPCHALTSVVQLYVAVARVKSCWVNVHSSRFKNQARSISLLPPQTQLRMRALRN